MATILFPRKGDRLRAHSVFFQAMRVAASGIGVMTGMVPSRTSAAAIGVAAGTYRNHSVVGAYAGGSLTSISAASSGKLRFDLIVFDVSDATLKRIVGSEDTPTVIGDFLEDSQVQPPELASASQILLGVARVSQNGVEAVAYGHYATDSIANMIIELSSPLPASTDVQFAATSRILGRKTAGAGVGEECTLSDILDFIGSAARGDILYRGASAWLRLGKGASGQRISQGADDPAWITCPFDIAFPFGDGANVITAASCSFPAPRMGCKIVSVRIRSFDVTGAPVSGSITCTVYKHSLSGALGSVVDTFALATATNMEEAGLSIAVSSGDWLTVVVSGITSCKQIVCSLSLEAT